MAAGSENVRHRDVKCFGSVSGAGGTVGSQGAPAAALLGAHVVISFLQEMAVAKGWSDVGGSVRRAGSGARAAWIALGRTRNREAVRDPRSTPLAGYRQAWAMVSGEGVASAGQTDAMSRHDADPFSSEGRQE